MGRELKVYRLTDEIMRYGKGRLDYGDALAEATAYYKKKPWFVLSEWITHVGDQYAARIIADKLLASTSPL